jgi:hypothetical protein
MSKFTTLTTPQEALNLPEGRLIVYSFIETSFTPENLIEAATLIINGEKDKEEKTVFYSQAGVIVYAANNFEWGAGKDGGYKAT